MKRIFLMTLIFVMLAAVGKTSAQNQAPPETPLETEAIPLYNQGTTLYKTGKYQEAINAFKRSIRLKPDFAWAYNNLGVAYSDICRSSPQFGMRLLPFGTGFGSSFRI